MYLRPVRLTDALTWLAQHNPAILAGGTDFYSARIGRPVVNDVLDISAIAELKGIHEETNHWRFGALVTWTEIAEAPLARALHSLSVAARQIGGPQIRNAGTLGGNVGSRAPGADGIVALLALNATVELRSATGTRMLALTDFLATGRTALTPDTLICALRVPKRSGTVRSTFLKLAARRYLAGAIASVAAAVEIDAGGRVADAAVAVGACSPTAQRLSALEQDLRGCRLDANRDALIALHHVVPLDPVSDASASAEYRREATIALLRRAFEQLAHE